MKITFCGHADYFENKADKDYLLTLFDDLAAGEDLEFFVGKNGRFDSFALSCAKIYKQSHPNSKIYFVTPYIKNCTDSETYFDEILYPALENVPPKYAIIKRNQWMVDQCDVVIAYVKFNFGGARTTYNYALKRNKRIINLPL